LALPNVATWGDVARIETLVAQCMDADAVDNKVWSPLPTAAYVGDEKAVKDAGGARRGQGDRDKSTETESTPLHHASQNGHVEATRTLVALGADKETKSTETESTPLHHASQNGHVEATRTLVALDADKEARNAAGRPPLFGACAFGKTGAMEVALEPHADIQVKNCQQGTPLHAAKGTEKISGGGQGRRSRGGRRF